MNVDAYRYVVKDLVGSGTFGQVAKCYTEETNDYVAVKVIKNQPAYYTQAKFEIGVLHMVLSQSICFCSELLYLRLHSFQLSQALFALFVDEVVVQGLGYRYCKGSC